MHCQMQVMIGYCYQPSRLGTARPAVLLCALTRHATTAGWRQKTRCGASAAEGTQRPSQLPLTWVQRCVLAASCSKQLGSC